MAKLKDLAAMEDRLVAGHGMCLGCGIPLIFRIVLRATDDPLIIANATGCLEVCSFDYCWSRSHVQSFKKQGKDTRG